MKRPSHRDALSSGTQFKASVVQLIMNGRAEEALERLAKHYRINPPKMKIGLPRRHKVRSIGCYTARTQSIHLLNSDTVTNPFIVLHEFYHHLRTSIDKKHKGTENYANQFAQGYIEAYRTLRDTPYSETVTARQSIDLKE